MILYSATVIYCVCAMFVAGGREKVHVPLQAMLNLALAVALLPPVPSLKTEVLFYHLERRPLDEVLPQLIDKTLARGWRAVIQAASPERVDALDQLLWTYRNDSFLPHGTVKSGHADSQPVFLTTATDNPNAATVRFMVDGAQLEPLDEQLRTYARVVFMFDGGDRRELDAARAMWKAVKSTGASATYWQQGDAGKWEKKA